MGRMVDPVHPDSNLMAEELALLGHDIRTAVTDVLAGLTVIDDSSLSSFDRQQLNKAKVTCKSLARYLEEGLSTLLAQAPTQLEESCINLDQFLHDLMLRWAYSAGHRSPAVVLMTSALPHMLRCNRTALDRVLSNLLSNAITHSEGKAVMFHVSQPAADRLCFTITDNGPGFPEGIGNHPSYGSALPAWEDREGHGLGLGIARNLAGRMGATLTLRNLPEGGGVAEFLLPALFGPSPTAPPESAGKCLAEQNVLIAEDSTPQLLLLAQYLCELGAHVTMLRDGLAAETALKAGNFDLALIDLEMPGRTGPEICSALRDHSHPSGKTPRMVILTAHNLPAIHENALASGAHQILVKPITSAEALAEALRQSPAQPAADALPASPDGAADFARLLDIAGPDLAAELLARYDEDLSSVQSQLIAALAVQDWASLRSASHVLIALAGTAGMQRLEQSARAFNLAANEGDGITLSNHSSAVLDGLADLLAFVARTAQERQDQT